MKNKVLIIFKYPHNHWNEPVLNKFSNYYETHSIFISDFKDKNFVEIVNDINFLIKSKNIEIVVFDVDYFKFINFFFINKIDCKKKILITGDDSELHEINSITASACDLVLSACPLSVFKYREKGYESLLIHFESGKINNSNREKEIDVLFFGALTVDRKKFLDHVEKEGINLKNIGHEEGADGLPEDQLLNFISKSKIVLNLSKTRTSSIKNFSSEGIYNYYYQFKGRIIMAGLNGAVCVSEYSPGQEMLFNENEVPTFFSKEECLSIVKKLLKDKELYERYRKNFFTKVSELCEDSKNFKPIFDNIEKPSHRKIKLIKFPYWYLRIAAKQIILRNIKLSRIVKNIFQLGTIYELAKNSNPAIKFLIIFETFLNILWYSITLTLKTKK